MTKIPICYEKFFCFLIISAMCTICNTDFCVKKRVCRTDRPVKVFLFKEALNNNFLCLFLVHSEGHKLDELVVIDSADSRLVNNLCIG